jgi:predicted DNA-binding transcriptional regulator AlpA
LQLRTWALILSPSFNHKQGDSMTEMPKRKPRKRPPHAGTAAVWPQGVQQMFDISAPTRWRYEKTGKLPPRDVHLGSKSGWRHETLAAFARSGIVSIDAAAADSKNTDR